jgi:hypothetical protein
MHGLDRALLFIDFPLNSQIVVKVANDQESPIRIDVPFRGIKIEKEAALRLADDVPRTSHQSGTFDWNPILNE